MIDLMTVAASAAPATDWWANLTSGGLAALGAGVLAAVGVWFTIRSQNRGLERTFEEQRTLQREQFAQQQDLLRIQFDEQAKARRHERVVAAVAAIHEAGVALLIEVDRPRDATASTVIDRCMNLMATLSLVLPYQLDVGARPMTLIMDCATKLDEVREACLPNEDGSEVAVHVLDFGKPAHVVTTVTNRWLLDGTIPDEWTYDGLAAGVKLPPGS